MPKTPATPQAVVRSPDFETVVQEFIDGQLYFFFESRNLLDHLEEVFANDPLFVGRPALREEIIHTTTYEFETNSFTKKDVEESVSLILGTLEHGISHETKELLYEKLLNTLLEFGTPEPVK